MRSSLTTPEENNLKLMLAGLPPTLTEEALKRYLRPILRTKYFSIELRKRNNSMENQGWAILHLSSPKIYNRILSQNFFILNDKKVFVKKYLQGKQLQECKHQLRERRLFLKGIPLGWADHRIGNFFKRFGDIEDAYGVRKSEAMNEAHQSDYALVIFKSADDARRVLKLGTIYADGHEVEVQKFRSKEEKIIERKQNKREVNKQKSAMDMIVEMQQNLMEFEWEEIPAAIPSPNATGRCFDTSNHIHFLEFNHQKPYHNTNVYNRSRNQHSKPYYQDDIQNFKRSSISEFLPRNPNSYKNWWYDGRRTLPNLDFSLIDQRDSMKEVIAKREHVLRNHGGRNLRLNAMKKLA